jgi:PadR family transcriptional regulator, regulatory protein PadR
MTRQDSLQGSISMLVLKLLASRGSLHGYGIGTCIQALSDEVLRVEQGSLYPALHRIEEGGWIKAKWETTENKRRVRVYEITPAGRKQLAEEEARWRTVTACVSQILQRA